MNQQINIPFQLCCQLPVDEKKTLDQQATLNIFPVILLTAATTCYYRTIRLLLLKYTELF